jgi:UDP-N-acetylglucosamine 1-carboxyvinyltransferase
MDDKFIIKGGNPLVGTVLAKGAKNAVGKMMIAALLTDEEVELSNIPRCGESDIAAEIVKSVGADVRFDGDKVIIKAEGEIKCLVSGISKRNRLPILAIGPLLHRCRSAEVPMVGGDKIGMRPVDFHIASLEALSVQIAITEDAICARTDGIKGAEISLPYPSVGATENTILTAVLAEGKTVLKNAAVEPEIEDLIKLLNLMGAKISLSITDRTITIDGVNVLHGAKHRLVPDRIESASFGIMAIATKGDITVKGTNKDHLDSFLTALDRMGGGYEIIEDGIRFFYKGPITAINIETDTYPAFVTDWQQPMVVLLTQAEGISEMHETVYENRFAYAEDLIKMGADIEVLTDCPYTECRYHGKGFSHLAKIKGPIKFHPAKLMVRDIRAGMAQIIAALVANGESEIEGAEHVDRGYENIDQRIRGLGGDITRVKASSY